MGIVQGSVTIVTNAGSGPYQVTMPKADLDIIGFAPLGYTNNVAQYSASPLVGIYIDASNIAYFPLPILPNYTVRKYSPVHVKVKGTVLNLYIPYLAQGGFLPPAGFGGAPNAVPHEPRFPLPAQWVQ